MAKKKNGLKVQIDTSSAEEFQIRLLQSKKDKLNSLMQRFNDSNKVTQGTRKGINSIMKKADNRYKVAEEVATKRAEEKKLQKEKKHGKRN